MGVQKPISEATKDDIVDRYQRGQSVRFIAFAFGISNNRVSQILAEKGVATRQNSAVMRKEIGQEQAIRAAENRARRRKRG